MAEDKKAAGTLKKRHSWNGVDGLLLAGDSWGDPQGQLVVMQHGFGQTRHAWKSAGEALGAAGYYVVAYDHRGHGDSQWSVQGNYNQSALLGDLQCIVSAIGKPRPILIGASMGGVNSLLAAGEELVDARALVLVDIAPRVEEQGADRILSFMAQSPDGFASLEEVADAVARYQPGHKRPKTPEGLAKNVRLGADGRYRWHWDPRMLATRGETSKRRERLEQSARKLRIPTLLVRGGLSDVITEQGAREFLQMCPHSEYVNVSGAGHMVAGHRNDAFTQAIFDFLARLGGPQSP